MNKTIVLYQSKYGATQRYAGWIAEALNCESASIKSFDAKRLGEYDTIVYGGGVYASGIKGLGLLKKHAKKLCGKRIVCFAVGAAPHEEATIENLKTKNLTDALENAAFFYCRGALDIQKMKGLDKVVMSMFAKMGAKKDSSEISPSDASLPENISEAQDWIDKDYLAPVIAYLRAEPSSL